MSALNYNPKPQHKILTKLLNGDEVAKILNISRTFAYQLMRQGKIKTIRMGRSVRVRVEDLEDFIASKIEGYIRRMNTRTIQILQTIFGALHTIGV